MKTYTTLLTAICLLVSLPLMAQQCLPTATTHLNVNNVDALIINGSDKYHDPASGISTYEVPYGSGKMSMYDAALWIGGIDASGNLHVAAETYRQTGNDFWAGPVEKNSCVLSADTNNCTSYQHVWSFTKSDILNYIFAGSLTNDILTYPANGNVAAGELPVLAPFYDVNGNGTYETVSHDYPLMDLYNALPDSVEHLYGDQCTYWIFNDTASASTLSGTAAMGIEVHAQAYAYLCANPYVNNTTFYRYKIINRSCMTYDSVYISHWTDPDLGYYKDDYAGCHIGKNIGYCYNGDNDDDLPDGYGLHPPAIGVQVLQGPPADANDGIDNNNDGVIDEPGEENLMTKFMVYNNTSDPVNGNPVAAQDYYNYMSGTWKNNVPMTYGGNGYNVGSNAYTSFMYPDNSDSAYFSTMGAWNETLVSNPPDDRRFVVSSGPFTFYPDQSVVLLYAVTWARDTAGTNLTSLDSLLVAADYIKNNFHFLDTLCNGSTGIASYEKPSAHSFEIVPNPAGDYCELHSNGAAHLSIINMLGEEVYQSEIENPKSEINLRGFPNGIYIVKLSSKDGVFEKKLVVQH
jgi:hypothetical protein